MSYSQWNLAIINHCQPGNSYKITITVTTHVTLVDIPDGKSGQCNMWTFWTFECKNNLREDQKLCFWYKIFLMSSIAWWRKHSFKTTIVVLKENPQINSRALWRYAASLRWWWKKQGINDSELKNWLRRVRLIKKRYKNIKKLYYYLTHFIFLYLYVGAGVICNKNLCLNKSKRAFHLSIKWKYKL